MKKLNSTQLRQLWLDFYKSKQHKDIGSASLIPDNDPSVLFTTAGMHPLVPYLTGQPHPMGKRLCNVQKCVRTGDIDEVGDDTHNTFFEMLGNWSLGDYFKQEQIQMSFEFLTSPQYLGIDKSRLAFTVFAGEGQIPRDDQSYEYWQSHGIDKNNIFFCDAKHNFWGLPSGGPCGPDTEMFFITDQPPCSKDCSPACSCGRYVEIWNDVFMQYHKSPEGQISELAQKNVDTGMGLERTLLLLQNVKSVYQTDVFVPIIQKIEELSGKKFGQDTQDTRAMKILADHLRTSVFMLGDVRGTQPSNTDQGYVLRRLIRRAVRFGKNLGLQENHYPQLVDAILQVYEHVYPDVCAKKQHIVDQLLQEINRFEATLIQGIKEFDKAATYAQNNTIAGKTAFRLYDTYGFPPEMTCELAHERGLVVDMEGYHKAFELHRQKSSQGADQLFKGGLADTSEQTARLHTATHLLLAALRKILGNEVEQRGSNITPDRLRFDFNFSRKLEDSELRQVEQFVNSAIAAKIDIKMQEMTASDAKKSGAIGIFDSKYGALVNVYTIEGYSKEICGGPHAKNTGELGTFKIQKEQSSSAGIRRIKAVLQ